MKKRPIELRTWRIVKFFLYAFAIVLGRVWFLGVVDHDRQLGEAKKPQRRTASIDIERATIRDRFNFPLAENISHYSAAVCYEDICTIPRTRWEMDERGKKRRVFARRKYIEELSAFLGSSLSMDPMEVEDLIHGRASLFPHTPFVLKEEISETLYFTLKAKEKDWPGIRMQQCASRVYPQGKTACDVVGYLGAISQREYLRIAREMRELKNYLSDRADDKLVVLPKGFSSPEEVEKRLEELKKRAYTINAQVGKCGVEGSYDELLRGKPGKKIFEVDTKGNTLRELPGGSLPQSGQRLILTLSKELQEEAEKLLSEYELLQDERDRMGTNNRMVPWQRGGAIVAMLPQTGEVVALASYPRFDPNDLIPSKSFAKRKEKHSSIIKWLESLSYMGDIWDGKVPLERERFSGREGAYYTEELYLDWNSYLDCILAKNSQIRRAIDQVDTIEKALALQEETDLPPFTYERDRTLFLDLLRLAVYAPAFSSTLREKVGKQTIAEHRLFCQTASCYMEPIKDLVKEAFKKTDFQRWRKSHFKGYLREKRREERAKKRYAKPYTEYLEMQERTLFAAFWEDAKAPCLLAFFTGQGEAPFQKELIHLRENCADPQLDNLSSFLQNLSPEAAKTYLGSLRSFSDLSRPLLGNYPNVRKQDGQSLEKHLAAAFYPYCGFGYGRSQAFRQASPMGSIFKVITAYAGLKQQVLSDAEKLNPLTLIDDMQWASVPGSNRQILGRHVNGEVIKRLYKGGRLPRAYPGIGKIDIVKALERTSNIYFSILAGDVLESPTALLEAAEEFGIGQKTGIDLPGEYRGLLPTDILHNKTGLYSFAIGQHSLVATPLQAATAACALANGGQLLQPQIVKLVAGENGELAFHEPKIKQQIFIPAEIQRTLLEGMHLVINGERGTARINKIRTQFHPKEAISAFRRLAPQIIGKTGTAEILYKGTIDAETKAQMEKHVWFEAICFTDETLTEPELVVVSYQRFGSAGKQGAPIAARMLEKWREICSKMKSL